MKKIKKKITQHVFQEGFDKMHFEISVINHSFPNQPPQHSEMG